MLGKAIFLVGYVAPAPVSWLLSTYGKTDQHGTSLYKVVKDAGIQELKSQELEGNSLMQDLVYNHYLEVGRSIVIAGNGSANNLLRKIKEESSTILKAGQRTLDSILITLVREMLFSSREEALSLMGISASPALQKKIDQLYPS